LKHGKALGKCSGGKTEVEAFLYDDFGFQILRDLDMQTARGQPTDYPYLIHINIR